MPLVVGTDARGRPIFTDPKADPSAINGGGISPASLVQAVDNVDPTKSNSQIAYESRADYNPSHNSLDTIAEQGRFATAQTQMSAARAMQARLLKAQQAASAQVAAASKNLGSGQIPGGTVIRSNSATQSTGGVVFNGSSAANDLRSRLVAKVASQKGVDYKWGGESPKTGFDCSGLVQWAYGKLGINMPRVSGQQAKMGTRAPINKLVPGDLVAHPGHIAVYAGNGMMWEAPHTGAQVRLVKVRSDMYGVHLHLPGD